MQAQKYTLGKTTAYTHKTCFETFPFPQNLRKGGSRTAPNNNIVQQIRNKTVELHEYRSQQMEEKQWGITQLYNINLIPQIINHNHKRSSNCFFLA